MYEMYSKQCVVLNSRKVISKIKKALFRGTFNFKVQIGNSLQEAIPLNGVFLYNNMS